MGMDVCVINTVIGYASKDVVTGNPFRYDSPESDLLPKTVVIVTEISNIIWFDTMDTSRTRMVQVNRK